MRAGLLRLASVVSSSMIALCLGCAPDASGTTQTGTGGVGGQGGTTGTTGGGGATSTTSTSTTSTSSTSTTSTTFTSTNTAPDKFPKECDIVYAQSNLPTFELEIDQDVWDALYQEWLHGYENEQAGLDPNPEHPLGTFKYEDEVIHNASIRLRGNTLWWLEEVKMQFEISFNTYDSGGRFHGMRHLDFDAAASNLSFLRDRLGLAILRDAGLAAPCANNARIVVNGVYYGLFTNLEHIDKSFLTRNYKNNDGDLYKRPGWELKTNEGDSDGSRLVALKATTTIDELGSFMNMDEATLEWAAEAVMPDNDGAWAGGYNFYLYDEPDSGKFLIIPYDLDSTFTRVPFDADPVTYLKPMDHGRPWYDLAVADPATLAKFKEQIKLVLDKAYNVDVLQGRIDAWGAQIEKASEEDINKPFTQAGHIAKVAEKREYVAKRAAFVKNWLCYDAGGADLDGDGNCDAP